MLVQVVALLGLGVLGSSAPLREERSRTSVGSIILELLQDMKKLNLNAVPGLVTVNATMERCMYSHLKTFNSTLRGLDTYSKFIATKLTTIDHNYRNILPKDLDKECQTAQVTWDEFLDTLEKFLRLLSEKIQNA